MTSRIQIRNIYQTINAASIILVIGPLAKGIGDICGDISDNFLSEIPNKLNHLLLALYIILFKIKTLIDDHAHFGEQVQEDLGIYRRIGFALAIVSWIFLAVGAGLINSPTKSAMMIVLSLLVSTSWIVVHLFELKAQKKKKKSDEKFTIDTIISLLREKWVLFNMAYICCLVIYIGFLSPVIKPEGSLSLCVLLAIFIYDYLSSRQSIQLDNSVSKSDEIDKK